MQARAFITRSIIILVIGSVFTFLYEIQTHSQDSSLNNLLFLPSAANGPRMLTETEPNNTSDKANGPLSTNGIYEGHHNDFSDYFKFTADTAGTITVNFTSNYLEGIDKGKIQIQLYHLSASVENRVGEAKTPPFTITHNGNQGLYYIRVFTDQCCLDNTKSYQLAISFPQATPTPSIIPTATHTPAATMTPTPTTSPSLCTPGHLGAGKPITVTMYNNCYYHFNVACEGCGMNEEDNYVVFYSSSTVSVTVPEGSVWQYNREPESGEVCNPPDGVLDHWPTDLPAFLSLAGVQQLFPCTPTPTQTPTETPTVSICLDPEEVRSWCEGASCNSERFEQLQEDNGVINPCGVKLKRGDPVAFDVPNEVSVDVWDCFNTSSVAGPVQLPQVCEASFRRCRATPHTGLAQGNHTFNGVAHIAELWRANGQTPWGDKLVTAAVMGNLKIIEAGGSVWTYPEGCQEVAKQEAAESALRTGAILITEAEMRDAGLIE